MDIVRSVLALIFQTERDVRPAEVKPTVSEAERNTREKVATVLLEHEEIMRDAKRKGLNAA